MSKDKKQEYQILHDDEIDVKALWMVLWTNKFALIKITGGFFVLGIVYIIFSTTLYYSNATIIQTEAEASSSMTSMLSLASSVGMDIGAPATAPTISVVDIVLSRTLRNSILDKTWITKQKKEVDLISYWEINDSSGVVNAIKSGIKSLMGSEKRNDEEARLKWYEEGRKILENRVIAGPNDNGLLMIEVWMEDPLITKEMTEYVIEAIIDYNKKIKSEQWKTNREFLIQRMQEVKLELQAAEDAMIQFQEDNRRVTDSPELLIELANLRRDVEIKTALYMTIQNEFEFVRMEEAKDSANILVLDGAYYPVEADQPKVIIILIVSILLGSILSMPIYLIYRSVKGR